MLFPPLLYLFPTLLNQSTGKTRKLLCLIWIICFGAQMVLKVEDFIRIKANWEPKSTNLKWLADELSPFSKFFVFVDDNPAEREIVRQQVTGAAVPLMEKVEHYIYAIDRVGYFETTNLSGDDIKRNNMYKENLKRTALENTFTDYQYLLSLDMQAEIKPFKSVYLIFY